MSGSPTPPLPPRIPGRIQMPLSRLLGTLTIVFIPVLAVVGVFGPAKTTKTVDAGAFSAAVEYPARMHFQEAGEVLVRVRNSGSGPVTAAVSFDPSFIERFRDIAFVPAEDKAYEVRLPDIAPGAGATMHLSLMGQEYGAQAGGVIIAAGGVTATVEMDIFVLP